MPIDPNISLRFQTPPVPDPLQGFQQVLGLRELIERARERKQLGPLRLKEAQLSVQGLEHEASERDRLMKGRAIYYKLVSEGLPDEQVAAELNKAGFPELAAGHVKSQKEAKEAASKLKKADLEFDQAQAASLADEAFMLKGLPEEQRIKLYPRLQQRAAQAGYADLAPEYDEAALEFLILRSKTAANVYSEVLKREPPEEAQTFDIAYKNYREAQGLPKNAKTEWEFRKNIWPGLKAQPAAPVAGRDFPLPADVAQQRKEIGAAGRVPALRPIQTVNEQGQTVTRFVTPEAGAEYPVGQTADMRNKEAGRQRVQVAIGSLKALGERVITEKLAIVQRAKATGRSVDAALRSDPEYRAYQDARMALAGNLAVAQQGSRPSDADVRAIWLPLVPDAFRDTTESAALKWNLIYINSGLKPPTQEGGQVPAGGERPPLSSFERK